MWALRGLGVGEGIQEGGQGQGSALTKQDHSAGKHNDQCTQADAHTSC